MKIPVVQREAYTIFLERHVGLTFVHCDVRKWNKATRLALHNDWETLCLLHNEPIYAYHEVGDRKHLKFLETYGFRLAGRFTANNLKEMQIFKKDNPYGN